MCYITATELKNNLGHYLDLCSKEDIYITKNNKIIGALCNHENLAFANFLKLEGILNTEDKNIDYKEMVIEGIKDKCGY